MITTPSKPIGDAVPIEQAERELGIFRTRLEQLRCSPVARGSQLALLIEQAAALENLALQCCPGDTVDWLALGTRIVVAKENRMCAALRLAEVQELTCRNLPTGTPTEDALFHLKRAADYLADGLAGARRAVPA